MAANDLSFNQISAILNGIVSQATGKTNIAPVNTNQFITVAQAVLKMGYDPLVNSISQVLSRTIFSTRPYSRKFDGIEYSQQKWGNMVRKINFVDGEFEDDDRLPLTEGASVDPYVVRKPNVLQTNFYGANMYQKHWTIFRDQLDSAFSGPNEFASFISALLTNITNQLEQARENIARSAVVNFIAGKIQGDTDSVYHVLTDYNAVTGLTLDAQSVYQPDNFKPFMQWLHSYIATITSLMTERSARFHINITNLGGVDKTVMRHTPYNKMKVYLYAPYRYQNSAMVLADTYHDDYLRYADNDTVNFWQSIESPAEINNTPVYLLPDGTLSTTTTATATDKVMGICMSEILNL